MTQALNPDGEETTPVSGMVSRLVLRYVRRNAGEAGVRRLLELAGDQRDPAELDQERTRSTIAQSEALLAAAAEVLDDRQTGYRIGASILEHRVGVPLLTVLRTLGSPGSVFRNVARIAKRFASDSAPTLVASGASHAVLAFDGALTPTVEACQFTAGVLSQVPVLFGLPPAEVRHSSCRRSGAPACVFRVSWARWSRLPRRALRRRLEFAEARATVADEQIEALHATVADLVSVDDLEVVLQRITARAGSAVRARRYFLVVRGAEDALRVFHEGFADPDEAHRLAEDVIDPETRSDDGRLVAEVASSVGHHGSLVALAEPGGGFLPTEQELLTSYARHAAVALDVASALAQARQRGQTTAALLELAGELAAATTIEQVATRLAAAVPRVTGAQCSEVFLRRGPEDAYVAGSHGWPPELEAALHQLTVGRSESDGYLRLWAEPGPRLIDRRTADPAVLALLEVFGVDCFALVPMVSQGEVVGGLVANWIGPGAPEGGGRARRQGLVDQGASAILVARLLEQVSHQAHHDHLTGLPNRLLFDEQLWAALADLDRCDPLAVLFVDLDGLKVVNDSLGHRAGDALLRAVALRLEAALRPGDLLARRSGDEFTVLCRGLQGELEALGIARRLLAALEEPVLLDGREVRATASVGIAVADGQSVDAGELVRQADVAMYKVKDRGGSDVEVFEAHPEGRLHRLEIELSLRRALERDELDLVYQPLVEVGTGRLHGFEALLRWHRPGGGVVAPAEFLPTAEETGLILPIGARVLERACREAARWADATDGLSVEVSVNLSVRQLADPGLIPTVAAVLAGAGLAPQALVLEITETAFIDDSAAEVARALAGLGVRLAVDDLGTGWSSLGLLKRLPVQRLKVDRCFVVGLGQDPQDAAIVAAVLRMADVLGVEVVAEGVEHHEQLAELRALGCPLAQGFLLGAPMYGADARLLVSGARADLGGPHAPGAVNWGPGR